MSPEQARVAALDGRSDLFAVGVMLWELLCGEALFHHGDSVEAALAAVLFGVVPSPRSRCPSIPEDVERVTMRLLEKQPEARYASATAALADLAACADSRKSRREDLVALLAERLPDRAPRRNHLPPPRFASLIEARPASGPAADAPPQPLHLTVAAARDRRLPEVVEPFGPAAARRSARLQRGTRSALVAVAVAVAVAALGAVLHLVEVRGADARRSEPPAPASVSPDPPAPSPPDLGAGPGSAQTSSTSTRGAPAEPATGAARLEEPRPARRRPAPAGRAESGPHERKPRTVTPPVQSGFREIDLRTTSSD